MDTMLTRSELTDKAIAADLAEDYEKALVYYRETLHCFMTLLEDTTHEGVKCEIRSVLDEFLERTETIKGIVKQHRDEAKNNTE